MISAVSREDLDMRKSISVVIVIAIMCALAMTPISSFAASSEPPAITADIYIEEMALDIQEPLIGYRQDVFKYVNYYAVNKVLTEYLFALEGWDLIPYLDDWNQHALTKGEFVSILQAVIKAEGGAGKYAWMFEFIDTYDEWDQRKHNYPLIMGEDDYITYQEAVTVLRQFNYYLHKVIGVQEDRLNYVTGRDFYNGFMKRYPDYELSRFIEINCAQYDETITPHEVQIFFHNLTEEILGKEECRRFELRPKPDDMSQGEYEDAFWSFFDFGIDEVEGRHMVRLHRGEQSAITSDELDAALDRFVDFIRTEEQKNAG